MVTGVDDAARVRGLDETRRLLYVGLFARFGRQAELWGTLAHSLIHHHPDVLAASGFTSERLIEVLMVVAGRDGEGEGDVSPELEHLISVVSGAAAAAP